MEVHFARLYCSLRRCAQGSASDGARADVHGGGPNPTSRDQLDNLRWKAWISMVLACYHLPVNSFCKAHLVGQVVCRGLGCLYAVLHQLRGNVGLINAERTNFDQRSPPQLGLQTRRFIHGMDCTPRRHVPAKRSRRRLGSIADTSARAKVLPRAKDKAQISSSCCPGWKHSMGTHKPAWSTASCTCEELGGHETVRRPYVRLMGHDGTHYCWSKAKAAWTTICCVAKEAFA